MASSNAPLKITEGHPSEQDLSLPAPTELKDEPLYALGDFTLDARAGLLYRNGELVKLRPKLLDLLTLLVRRKGAVVSHDEILRTVWPTTVVEESGLTRNISMLRKFLGCDGSTFIENIPRRGYRFVAEIREVSSIPPIAAPAVADTPASGPVVDTASAGAPTAPPRRRALFRWLIPAVVAAAVIALLLARLYPTRGPQLTQLTTNAPELPIIAAALSPDGRELAYGEGDHLYVKPVDSVESRELRMPPAAIPSSIDWFGDGSGVLVSGVDAGSRRSFAWVNRMDGAAPQILLPDAALAKLSHRSGRVAFVRKRSELWIAAANGSGARLLATTTDGRIRFSPQFSDDDAYLLIAIEADADSHTSIDVVRVADGRRTRLALPGDDVRGVVLVRGNELIVSSLVDGAVSTRLTAMSVDFARSAAGPARVVAEWAGTESFALHATADGRRVSMIRNRTDPDVYAATLDASGTRLSGLQRVTLDESRDRLSGWLDDRTVLFHSNRSGSYGIYRQALGDVRAQPLLTDERDNFRAIVTPDRRWLWYFSTPPDASSPMQLVRRPLDGGAPWVASTTEGMGSGLRCVRAGGCVRMDTDDGMRLFYAFDPETGTGRELGRVASGDGNTQDWDVSPEGTRIALVNAAPGAILVLDATSKPARQQTVGLPEGCPAPYSVAWDARGAGFYVVCLDEFDGSLLHVALDGTSNVMLHRPKDPVRWVIPSPDGGHLALQSWTDATNVWMWERP